MRWRPFVPILFLLAAGCAQEEGASPTKSSLPPNTPAQSAAGSKATGPAENYRALVAEYDSARQEFMRLYRAAKSSADRQAAMARYPKPDAYAGRFMDLATAHPEDQDALIWIVGNAGHSPQAAQALELLRTEHVRSEQIGSVCRSLVYVSDPKAEQCLRAILKENPVQRVQAQACYCLGLWLKRKGQPGGPENAAYTNEAEQLFEQVLADFSEISGLVTAAKAELHELRNLTVGKTAPNIQGEDIDGQSFQLSDYRGKVVVLDFWGNW